MSNPYAALVPQGGNDAQPAFYGATSQQQQQQQQPQPYPSSFAQPAFDPSQPQPPQQPLYYAQPVYPDAAAAAAAAANAKGADGRCCGCRNTCCLPYLHVAVLMMMCIAVVSCLVALTGEMHWARLDCGSCGSSARTTSFYRDHLIDYGRSISYSSHSNSGAKEVLSDCAGAGTALLVLMLLSLFLLCVGVVFIAARMLNRGTAATKRASSSVEIVTTGTAMLLVGVAVFVWRIGCLNKAPDYFESTARTVTTLGTGYAFLTVSACLLLASLVHVVVIWRNPYFRNYGRPQQNANANVVTAVTVAVGYPPMPVPSY